MVLSHSLVVAGVISCHCLHFLAVQSLRFATCAGGDGRLLCGERSVTGDIHNLIFSAAGSKRRGPCGMKFCFSRANHDGGRGLSFKLIILASWFQCSTWSAA